MKVSILMLTYNAPWYVYKSITTLKKTENVDYELIIVDNNSNIITRKILKLLYKKGYIDKIFFNDKNSLFAEGNNIASRMVDSSSKYLLLLNSDIKIIDKKWLMNLINIHPKNGGISAFGAVLSEPKRADGYCMLIDKDLYIKYKLDKEYQWWWSVTKLESNILNENKEIIAVVNHESQIHHYGGASGKGYKDAKGMDINIEEVKKWFKFGEVKFINKI